jgi:hypothetical protein
MPPPASAPTPPPRLAADLLETAGTLLVVSARHRPSPWVGLNAIHLGASPTPRAGSLTPPCHPDRVEGAPTRVARIVDPHGVVARTVNM